MPAKIRLDNFSPSNKIENAILDADSIVGATSLVLKNSHGINANDYIMVGALGGERSELKQVSTINADQVTVTLLTAAKEAHSRFETITSLFGNQLKIYRASNVDGTIPADNQFATIVTTPIDPDQLYTDYTDATGSSNYWYKYTYYNSTALTETTLSDAVAVRGGGYGNYCSVDDIRFEGGLKNNRWITDADIDFYRLSAQSEIDATLTGTYSIPFTSPINPMIAEIARKLAAGFLLSKNYGPTSTLNTNGGQSKVDEARKLLQQLNAKKITLVDNLGGSLAITTAVGAVSIWPDASTAAAIGSDGGGERMFRVSDISGNGGRY